ncbi:MAG TPA: hypothetical protein VFQ87_19235, partial [Bradyrhizobium sp.]|nr:hypothetical protein [Bradyrhizobium sp.]
MIEPTLFKPSKGAISVSIVLAVIAGLLWLLSLATLADLGRSDAAGNALGEAYAAIQIIALWMLLSVMTVIAAVKGRAPWPAIAATVVIVPLSGVLAMSAMALLTRAHLPPFLWPIVIPAAIPPLVLLWCFLSLQGRAGNAIAALPAAMLAVCLLIEPLSLTRKTVDDRQTARLQKYDADLERVSAGAPMWEWTPFLDTADSTKQARVLDNIRGLEQRQQQAEIMLDRGDFPVGYLGFFDLDPTPSLCGKARGLLRRQVEPLVLKTADSRPYRTIAGEVADAVAGMSWLVGYGCSCDLESKAWETMA